MKSESDLEENLKRLGFNGNFTPYVVVEKFRRSFIYKEYEISIDEVKGLGDFIEVEYKGNDQNIDKVLSFLEIILKEIPANIGVKDCKGYAFKILNLKHFKGVQK